MKYLMTITLAILTGFLILQLRFDSKEYERGWTTHKLEHTTENWNELMEFVELEEFMVKEIRDDPNFENCILLKP